MTLGQRQPRLEDPAYLAYVRTLPCLVCGRGPSDPAHIRAAAPHYGKRYTGKGEKPDDKWVLPLCRRHHAAQHRESELGWWAGMGAADPFAIAAALYASRPNASRPRATRHVAPKVRVRKPKAERIIMADWQPIATAPKDGTWIMLWREPLPPDGPMWDCLITARWWKYEDGDEEWAWPSDTSEVFSEHGRFHADGMLNDGDSYSTLKGFTHWMPLPEPPK